MCATAEIPTINHADIIYIFAYVSIYKNST